MDTVTVTCMPEAAPGYPSVVGPDLTTVRDRTVLSGVDLVELLRAQHDELGEALTRLPALRGAARADVYLQLRRRFAVHEALEAQLVAARLPGSVALDLDSLHEEVLASERSRLDEPTFDLALVRLLAAHRRHVQAQEEHVLGELSGALGSGEQAVASTAISMWLGDGEVYLGNEFAAMVTAARDQLAEAPGPGPATSGS